MATPSPHVWGGRSVLLTGHTGFKGAWLGRWLGSLGAEVHGLALDPPPGGAGAVLGQHLASDSRADLRDEAAVRSVVKHAAPEVVFHLAAQPIVSTGYADPVGTYATNVQGTVHLLDALREVDDLRAAVVVTSDKVYRHQPGRRYVEEDPLGHSDPYSNSKALVEVLARGWSEAFFQQRGVALATARAGNVIGGGDVSPARLIPDVLRAAAVGQAVMLRRPKATRPWQHVLEPLSGYLLLAERLLSDAASTPTAFNFGPPREAQVTVDQVVAKLLDLVDAPSWKPDPAVDYAEAPDLQLDSRLARTVLGWAPRLDLDMAVRWTVEWWQVEQAGGDTSVVADRQLAQYASLSALPSTA